MTEITAADLAKDLIEDTRTKAYILVSIGENSDDGELSHITLFGDRHPEYQNNVRLCASAISKLMRDTEHGDFDKDKDTHDFISDVIDEVKRIQQEGSDE